MIVQYHRGAPELQIDSGYSNMAGVLDINEAGFDAARDLSLERVLSDPRLRVPFSRAFLDRQETEERARRARQIDNHCDGLAEPFAILLRQTGERFRQAALRLRRCS